MSFRGGNPVEVIEKDLARKAAEGKVALAAASVPLPGPAADVFSLAPYIPVGPYKVRPFYDIDWEFLKALGHPLYAIMRASLDSTSPQEQFVPMGQNMWDLAYLFTRSPDEGERAMLEGLEQFRTKSRREFGMLQFPALRALAEAVGRQQSIYWSVGKSSEDANAANPTSPPPTS